MATVNNSSEQNIPRPALILGLGSTLPFIICTIGIWFAPERSYFWYLDWLLTYGAVLLSFLGAVHFGPALTQKSATWQPYAWSAAPGLIGWLALLMNPVPAFSCLAFGYVIAFFADHRAIQSNVLPSWYMTIRKPMTLTALSAMSLAIARIATA